MSKGRGNKALLILMLVGALGVGALAYYVKLDALAAHVPADLRADTPIVRVTHKQTQGEGSDDSVKADQTPPQSILLPELHESTATLATEKTDVPEGKDPKTFLAEQILAASGMSKVPVMGVDVNNRVVTVNFGQGIDDGMGSSQEGAFIKALQIGYGQFPEIDKIQITKNGQNIDSIGGHIETNDPLSVIRPGQSSEAPSTPSEP